MDEELMFNGRANSVLVIKWINQLLMMKYVNAVCNGGMRSDQGKNPPALPGIESWTIH